MARRTRRKTRGSTYRRRHYRRNPINRVSRRRRVHRTRSIHRRRHYRRNPAVAISPWKIMSWLPLAGTVAASMTATVAAPGMVLGAGATKYQAYLTQAAVGVAGLFVLPMVGFRGFYGPLWFLTSMGTILGDWVGRYFSAGAGAMQAYPKQLGQPSGLYYPPALSPYRRQMYYAPSYGTARRGY